MQKKKNLFLKDIVEISPNITMSEKHSTFHVNGQLNLNEKISTEISFSLMNHKTNHEYSMKSQLTKSDSNSSTYNFEASLNLDELSFKTQDDYFSIIVHVEEVYYHHSQMVAFQTNKRFDVLNADTIIYFEEVGLSKTFQLLNTKTFFSKYELEAEIHDVTLEKSTHHILIKGPKKTGIVRQIPYSLVLKKRKAEDEYVHTVPDESIHAQWETSLPFKSSDHFLTEGIWDFYLEAEILEAHKKERLSYPLEQSTLPKPFLTELNHKLYSIEFYQTIKGNLSVKVTEETLTGTIDSLKMDQGTLQMKAHIAPHPLLNAQTLGSLSLWNENHKEWTPDIKTDVKMDKHTFAIQIPLNQLIKENYGQINEWKLMLGANYNHSHVFIPLKLNKEHLNLNDYFQFIKKGNRISLFYLSFNKNKILTIQQSEPVIKNNIESYSINETEVDLYGYAYIKGLSHLPHQNRTLILRHRTENKIQRFTLNSQLKENNSKNPEESYRDFHVRIPISALYDTDGKWDAFIEIIYDELAFERKLGSKNFTFKKDAAIEEQVLKRKEEIKKVYISCSPRKNLQIEVNTFSKKLQQLLRIAEWLYERKYKKRNIWLIGERTDTAQDTGYHFFKYCRENYPNKEIYYVIDKNSKDLKNIEPLGNVIYYKSDKHYLLSLMATTYITSHEISYILPFKGFEMDNYANKKKVFLQHGVLGRKDVEYHKHFYDYPFHLFMVSSEREKKLVQEKMKYKDNEVKITGLTRFDALPLNRTEAPNKKIIIIPTWREWLNTDEKVLASDYYKRYASLLSNEDLQTYLFKNQIQLIFYPHYLMQPYIKHFSHYANEQIKIIALGERKVQDLLIESDVMITDYSSVSFDFSYMDKPIIFYHFDYDRFFKNGLLSNPADTFLGSIVYDEKEVLEELIKYTNNLYKEPTADLGKKQNLFTHIDHKNSERVYEEIENLTTEK